MPNSKPWASATPTRLRQGFAERSSTIKPWTCGPSDPLPLRAALTDGIDCDAIDQGQPAKKPREPSIFAQGNGQTMAGPRRSIASNKSEKPEVKGNPVERKGQGQGVMEAPAFGRSQTRYALLVSETLPPWSGTFCRPSVLNDLQYPYAPTCNTGRARIKGVSITLPARQQPMECAYRRCFAIGVENLESA